MSKNKKWLLISVMAAIWCFPAGTGQLYGAQSAQTLVRFDESFKVGSVMTSDAKVVRSGAGTLRIETGHEKAWPGITIKAPEGKWNLSKYEYVSMAIKNVGDESVTVSCRVDNPGADGAKNCVTDSITLGAGKEGTLTVRIYPTPWVLSEPLELIGMRGAPAHSGKVDASNVTQVLVFVTRPKVDYTFEIGNVSADVLSLH